MESKPAYFSLLGWYIKGFILQLAMAFKFEKLDIWKQAFELSDRINELTKQFPAHELYNLSNQMRKAADSVTLNIAEGCTGQSNAVQRNFLSYSIRSAIEVVGCLFLAKRRKYIVENAFQSLYTDYEKLVKQISTMRDRL